MSNLAEVDNLEIKVEATSRGANQQLKILIGMMDELSAKLNGMNTKNFESLATLMKSLSSMAGSVKNASNGFKEANKNIGDISETSKKAKKVLDDLFANSDKIGRNISMPKGIIEQQNELKKLESEYDRLLQRQEKYVYTGNSMESKSWVNLQYDIIKTQNRMEDLKQSIESTKAKANEEIQFNVTVPDFDNEKFDLSDLILSQNTLGLEKTFEDFHTTVNNVFSDVRSDIDSVISKTVDLSNIDVSSVFQNMEIKDNAPAEVELIVGKYNKLREELLELEDIYNDVAESSKNFTDAGQGETPVNVAQQTVERIQEVVAQMTSLRQSAKAINESIATPFENLVDTSYLSEMNIKQLKEELKNTSAELEKINSQVSSWSDKKGNIDFNAVDSDTLEDMNYYKQLIPQIQDKIAQLKVEGNGGFLSGLSASFSSFKQDAETTGSKIEALKLAFSSLTGYMSQSGNTGLMVASGAMKGIATACSGAISAIKGLWSSAKKIAPVFKTIGSVALKSFSKIASVGVTPISKAFKGLGNVLGSVNKKIQRTAKMFSLMILRKALRAVIDNITKSFQELAKQNASVNSSVSSIVSNFKYLGASITAAFSPIFSVVAPILDALVEKCVSVINTIGQVFASLTGSGTYTYAKKVQVDYAGSLDNTAKSANDATKAVKEYENQLMGFDEINKLTDNSGSGSNGSSGGSGGSGAIGSSPEYVFETANVESQYNKWADMIKEAWKNGDFTELGEIVGEKLNSALENIPWDKIKENCNKVASSIATFLNGFMQGADFTLIGETLAEALNTAFGMAYTFIKKFDFALFGTKVADLLNGAFQTIDWNLIANTITGSINGVFESILNFATNFKWGENAKKIADGIKTLFDGIDWDTITKALEESGKGLGEAINKLFYVDKDRSLGSDLSKAVWSAFNSLVSGIDKFIKETNWAGLGANLSQAIFGVITDVDWKKLARTASDAVIGAFDLLKGAFDGIDWNEYGKNLVRDVKAVWTNIDWKGIISSAWDALVSAVKAVFGLIGGIFEEIGKDIYDGLIKGLGDNFKNINTWIKKNIFGKISSAFDNAKDSIGEIAINLKGKVEVNAKTTGEKAINSIKSAWNSIKAGTKSILVKAKTSGQSAIKKLKKAWSGLKSKTIKLRIKVSGVIGNVKKILNSKIIKPLNKKLPKIFPKIPLFAQGGFPNMGQMFIARERGPEMVGKIGSRNAVVNNNQIVEGVANGVYNAVVSAMATVGNNQGSNVNINLVGDTKKIFKVVQQEGRNYQLATGNAVF